MTAIIVIIYFILLYFIAFIANRNYRDKDDILFISKTQWRALIILWIPSIIALLRER